MVSAYLFRTTTNQIIHPFKTVGPIFVGALVVELNNNDYDGRCLNRTLRSFMLL